MALFNMRAKNLLISMAQKHNVLIHFYTDDTQFYLPLDEDENKEARKQHEERSDDIGLSMALSFLQVRSLH